MKYDSANGLDGLYRKLFTQSLDIIILKYLDKKPMYASEIDRLISDRFESNASEDAMRRLKNLSGRGLVELAKKYESRQRERRRDSRIKPYTITEQGRDMLHGYEEEYRSFVTHMGMLFGHS